MRIINIYLAKTCRKLGGWHVDAADFWQRQADAFDARATPLSSDNIANIEPYDRDKHGEVR